jgi:catechol 2,3-dioxygenase-like lactoylglutathione lyase family enzyme
MNDKLRFEGLTLTVESVERSIAFYGGRLGLKVEINAAPNFAMIRHGGVTLGLLSAAVARKEGWERSMSALDPDGYLVEFAQGRRGKNQPKP